MVHQLREALEEAGFTATTRLQDEEAKAERRKREERQAADARRLEQARAGLAAMTKKDTK